MRVFSTVCAVYSSALMCVCVCVCVCEYRAWIVASGRVSEVVLVACEVWMQQCCLIVSWHTFVAVMDASTCCLLNGVEPSLHLQSVKK
jgi:hypothetical protein